MKMRRSPMLHVTAAAVWAAAAITWFANGAPVVGLVCAAAGGGHIAAGTVIARSRVDGGNL